MVKESHTTPEVSTSGSADNLCATPDADLIRHMEADPDTGYEDEARELNRRLALGGLAWHWVTVEGEDRIEVFPADPTPEYDGDNRCVICRAHIAEPHEPECARGDES